MSDVPPHDTTAPELAPLAARRQVPAWALSIALHLTLVTAAAFVVQATPQGAAPEPDRNGGIVLVKHDSAERSYLEEGELELQGEASAGEDTAAATDNLAAALPVATPSQLAGMLPSAEQSLTDGNGLADVLPGAGGMTEGGSRGKSTGGYATTGVFGIEGQGSKFVYVFDRSGSMQGFQGRPLAAAKRELIASLSDLESVHQFQIIFYNERPYVCNPHQNSSPRLLYGTDADRNLAVDFVKAVVADGGTRHLEALKLAIGMRPDVIFFLTDADEPRLTATELAKLRRLNQSAGASINSIEFGAGASTGNFNFLVQLARQNNGQHVYVDVTRLPLSP
jgi:hypothetical protein